MRPSRRNGRKRAERAPATTCTSPSATPRHRRARLRAETPECHSAGRAPKRAAKRSRNCAVKRDFGHQDQRLAVLPQRRGDSLEIDFRLAGAGDAFEQSDGEGAFRHGRVEGQGGRRLLRLERRPARNRDRALRRGGLRRQRDGFERAVVDEPVDDARRTAGELGERRFRHARSRPRRQRAPAGGPGVRRCGAAAGEPHADAQRLGPGGLGRAHPHPQHHAARRQRPAGDPIDEPAQRLAERRQIALGDDGFQIGGVGRRPDLPDDAGRLAIAERHLDEIARAPARGQAARDRNKRCRPPPGRGHRRPSWCRS